MVMEILKLDKNGAASLFWTVAIPKGNYSEKNMRVIIPEKKHIIILFCRYPSPNHNPNPPFEVKLIHFEVKLIFGITPPNARFGIITLRNNS